MGNVDPYVAKNAALPCLSQYRKSRDWLWLETVFGSMRSMERRSQSEGVDVLCWEQARNQSRLNIVYVRGVGRVDADRSHGERYREMP